VKTTFSLGLSSNRIFPHGGFKEVDLSEGFYQYDYSIYSHTIQDYIAHGTVFGNGFANILDVSKEKPMPSINADFELGDMTLEICEGSLEVNSEKELVVFS
jgi:hypothetical protein